MCNAERKASESNSQDTRHATQDQPNHPHVLLKEVEFDFKINLCLKSSFVVLFLGLAAKSEYQNFSAPLLWTFFPRLRGAPGRDNIGR